MNKTTNLPNRQSHRYREYDYTSAGAYFVTICVRYGHCLLGDVRDGQMVLNSAGEAVLTCWNELLERFPTIGLDEFQVMPNHAHGVVWLQVDPVDTVGALLAAPSGVLDAPGAASNAPTDPTAEAGTASSAPTDPTAEAGTASSAATDPTAEAGAASSAPTEKNNVVLRPTLGQVMRTLKSKSAIAVNDLLGRSGPFWLRDYWDRIVRNDEELANIRNYIRTNPQRWREDQLHPEAPPNKWNQWDNP